MGVFSRQDKWHIGIWCLFDWAGASFSVIVTTFIFATYFTTQVASNPIHGTYLWANAASFAGLIIALSSPLVGAIADHGGHHKRWLFVFTQMAVIASALLWFAYPDPRAVPWTLFCVIIGTIGFEVSLVFYNAFLPFLGTKPYLGRISGWGWGSGYLGGIVALTLCLLLFIQGNVFHLTASTAGPIRACGPFVALWFFLFSLPLFIGLPDINTSKKPLPEAVRLGWRELVQTLKHLPAERNIFLYLFAHMIYTDGLNTLFAFGGIYAAGTYGLSFQEVLLFGITMNITAGIGAISLGWLDDTLGSKLTVILSLACLSVSAIPILFLHNKYWFWGVALFLCIFVGPIQSASRSLMVRLIAHKSTSTEMFGLYALSGKITAFIGPWLLGMMTLVSGSQRVGMTTVLAFFIIGALLLLPVQSPEGNPRSGEG